MISTAAGIMIFCYAVILTLPFYFKLINKFDKLFFIFIIFLFVVYKYAQQNSDAVKTLNLIGFSYAFLKFIQTYIDIKNKSIEKLNFTSVYLYFGLPMTLHSGPIEKYRLFEEKINAPKFFSEQILFDGVFKIMTGLIKLLLADLAVDKFNILAFKIEILQIRQLLSMPYLYMLVIYCNFSGYTDVALGIGKLFGISLTDNFNKPYKRSNIIDFWNNWHITLSTWLQEIIFIPCRRRLGAVLKLDSYLLAGLASAVTMTVCGLWHGFTLNFLFWGIYHGAGIFITRLYQKKMLDYFGQKKYFSIKKNYAYILISWLATFNFICMGWFLFCFDIKKLEFILNKISVLL